jgi:hypothetical protein
MHASSHGERDMIISRDASLRSIYGRFRQLRVDSVNARYECWRPSASDVERAEEQLFKPLQAYLRGVA